MRGAIPDGIGEAGKPLLRDLGPAPTQPAAEQWPLSSGLMRR
jgi:hypothetical protein